MIQLKCEQCGRLLAEFQPLPKGKYRTIPHALAVAMPIDGKPGEAYAECPDCHHVNPFDIRYLARPYPKDEDED